MPLAEKTLIQKIRREAGDPRKGRELITGIGDDCAVLRLPGGHEAVITTDFSLEGVHFRRDWHPPEVVGHRCLTRGLSDIAAMGGEPIAAFLSLALPAALPQSWVDKFMRGFLSLAKHFAVALAGGDTAESPEGILADIVLLGSVPQGKAILRSGARPGNPIYVTGALGGSAATIELLRRSGPGLRASEFAAHFAPTPRVEVGRVLREKKIALAMIDISDGLSTDLAHMCEGSGVGAEIEAEAIPLGRIGRPSRPVDLRLALHGGDDYELLFAVSPHAAIPARIAGVPITRIGRITRSRHLVLIAEGKRRKLVPQGWQHFRA